MKSNYKRIGDYIRLVDNRNTDLSVENLLGLSITKEFVPSVANTVGTDMSKYKVVKKNQFVCSTMQVRRDKKMPVALLQHVDEGIISPAYYVFEVIDEDILLPEYLMMWFSRSEFDREACFYAIGGVRGSLEWEDFCDMKLPIPSIEKQREIVKEYNTILNRIKLNKRSLVNLEELAHAIFKEWFVDFKYSLKSNNNYKSIDIREKEGLNSVNNMPLGWHEESIGEFVDLSQGLAINAKTDHLIITNNEEGGIPLLRITDLINGTKEIFIDRDVSKKNIVSRDEIIVTRTGQVGLVFRNKEGVLHNNCFKVNIKNSRINKDYLFWFLKRENTRKMMIEVAAGSAQADLSHSSFKKLKIIIPDYELQCLFSEKIKRIQKAMDIREEFIYKLDDIRRILLARIATMEG